MGSKLKNRSFWGKKPFADGTRIFTSNHPVASSVPAQASHPGRTRINILGGKTFGLPTWSNQTCLIASIDFFLPSLFFVSIVTYQLPWPLSHSFLNSLRYLTNFELHHTMLMLTGSGFPFKDRLVYYLRLNVSATFLSGPIFYSPNFGFHCPLLGCKQVFTLSMASLKVLSG